MTYKVQIVFSTDAFSGIYQWIYICTNAPSSAPCDVYNIFLSSFKIEKIIIFSIKQLLIFSWFTKPICVYIRFFEIYNLKLSNHYKITVNLCKHFAKRLRLYNNVQTIFIENSLLLSTIQLLMFILCIYFLFKIISFPIRFVVSSTIFQGSMSWGSFN